MYRVIFDDKGFSLWEDRGETQNKYVLVNNDQRKVVQAFIGHLSEISEELPLPIKAAFNLLDQGIPLIDD